MDEGRYRINFPEGKFISDNPLDDDWLQENPSTMTACYQDVRVDPRDIIKLPGYSGEHLRPFYRPAIERRIKEKKFDGALIRIDKNGNATIYEGNHRLRAAIEAEVETVLIDVSYLGGSERLPNVWKPTLKDKEGNIIKEESGKKIEAFCLKNKLNKKPPKVCLS